MSKRVLFVYPKRSTFVDRDIRALEVHYTVLRSPAQWHGRFLGTAAVKQMIFLIRHLRRAEVVYVMFAGHWSLLPVLFGQIWRRRVYVILGGADCVSFPKLHYGSLRKRILKKIIGYSVRKCSGLLPVSEQLIGYSQTYSNLGPSQQGLRHFFSGIDQKYLTMHNGFDADYWDGSSSVKKPNSYIAVAGIPDQTRFVLKGIDLMVFLAKHMPDADFTVVGFSPEFARSAGEFPRNFKIIEHADLDRVKQEMLSAQYVLQLSVSEGFPNALCQAMLCKCVPIGSRVGAIADIIGEAGLVIERRDPASILASVIKFTQTADFQTLSMKARNRVRDLYPIEKRTQLFIDVVENKTLPWRKISEL